MFDKKILESVSLILFLGASLITAQGGKMEKNLKIQWFGHACFLITDSKGNKVVTDPFDKSVGYPMPDITAEIVLVSHSHFDHNNVGLVKGKPQVIQGYGKKTAKGTELNCVKTYHDDQQGKSGRGENTVFVWKMEGIKLAHCGDLGHLLTEQNLKEIGQVDVLMIPVGGFYTIDAKTATQNIEKLKPKVVLPMHYKTPVMGANFPIAKVDDFLAGKKNVQKAGKNYLELSKDTLPKETTVYVLEYK